MYVLRGLYHILKALMAELHELHMAHIRREHHKGAHPAKHHFQ